MFVSVKEMRGVLVYVGAVAGGELTTLASKFDRVIAIQALPDEASKLKEAHPGVVVIQGAATLKGGCTATLHVASNVHSSSLGPFNKDWAQKHPSLSMRHTVQVSTINLNEVCREHKVDHIDLLVSDVQGGDYEVVASMEPMLKQKRVRQLRCKTTRDGYRNVHDGLPSNELQALRNFFQSVGYQLCGVGWGDVAPGTFEPVAADWWEYHTAWAPLLSNPSEINNNSSTSIVALYGLQWSEDIRKTLAAIDGPLILFCDDADQQQTYLRAWKARRNHLDSTMFVCVRREHLPWHSKLKADVLPGLSFPHFVERSIALNPFNSSHFSILNPASSQKPTKLTSADNCLEVAEGSSVGGSAEQMGDTFRVLNRLYGAAIDAGQTPDPSFCFSSKLLRLPTKNPCGGCDQDKKNTVDQDKKKTVSDSQRADQDKKKTLPDSESAVSDAEWARAAGSAKHLREAGDPAAALQSLCKTIERCAPTGGGARREAVAEGKFWAEVMLNAWFAGDRRLCVEAFERCTDLDPETYELAGKLAKLLAIRLSSLCPSDELKVVEVPVAKRPNLVNGNLTILPYGKENYLAVARMINWINGQCVHPQRILTNENSVLLLDKDFKVVREGELADASRRPTKPTGWTGFEDVRLYHADADAGTFHFTSSLFDHEGGGKPQICRCLATYMGGGKWEVVQVQPLLRLDPSGEKNWLVFKPPQRKEPETLWAVYHWYPRFHILELKPDGTHATVFREEEDRPGSFHQGSSAPIYVESMDCWLALLHESWDVFFHRFVLLDKDTIKIAKIGPLMYLHRMGIEYACGMCLSHDKRALVISYGFGDSSSHVIQIPLSSVQSIFK